jgi:hypothetical protein
MRAIFGKLHRWAGLLTAGFLFFSGITGAIISWDHEIDDVLNSHLFDVTSKGPAIPSIELAKMIEQRDPRARVVYLFMTPEEGHSLWFFVMPRIDPATGKRYALDYNQIFLDPNTGVELGRRYWGAVWPVTRENLVSFLYKLHYTMHIPEFWGSDRWGMRVLGIIAIIWTIDCFVGFYLTLPSRRRARAARAPAVTRQLERGFWARWAPAWTIKTSGSAYRINFDIHRAFSLWTWSLLFVIAFTAFSLNLYFEVFSPLPRSRRPHRTQDDLRRNRCPRGRRWQSTWLDHPGRGDQLRTGPWRLCRRLLPPRRRSRGRRRRPGAALLRQRGWPPHRRTAALGRHRRRYLRAGAVSAALGTHRRPVRAHPDLDHGARGGRTLGHGCRHLVAQATRPGPRSRDRNGALE